MSNAKHINKKKFNSTLKEKLKHNGEYEFEKAKFLLEFDWDPEAQKEALELIRIAISKKYQPAKNFSKEMKKDKKFALALDLYKFVYGSNPF